MMLESTRIKREFWKQNSLCISCGELRDHPPLKQCEKCLQSRRDSSRRRYQKGLIRNDPVYLRAWRQHRKIEVLEAYGGVCACCGETDLVFLSIDHVNNDGKYHRQTVRSGAETYAWLHREKYPPGFQVYCFNCNIGKHINGGVCPHQEYVKNDITTL